MKRLVGGRGGRWQINESFAGTEGERGEVKEI